MSNRCFGTEVLYFEGFVVLPLNEDPFARVSMCVYVFFTGTCGLHLVRDCGLRRIEWRSTLRLSPGVVSSVTRVPISSSRTYLGLLVLTTYWKMGWVGRWTRLCEFYVLNPGREGLGTKTKRRTRFYGKTPVTSLDEVQSNYVTRGPE